MTYTYAILDVTSECFREIQTKLEAAGYQHLFSADDTGQLVIDLRGVAIRDEEGDDGPDLERLERPDETATRPTRRS